MKQKGIYFLVGEPVGKIELPSTKKASRNLYHVGIVGIDGIFWKNKKTDSLMQHEYSAEECLE